MNISAIQQSYGMAQSPATAKKSDSGNSLPGATSSDGATDTVNFSTRGRSLSGMPSLMLPTRENVQKLSSALSDDLKKLFNQAGINPTPPVEFAVDSYTGQVSVKGNRPDAQQITDLIKKNPDVELQIHNVAAISSHVVAMGPAMEADTAYRAAKNQAEINNVVAKYSSVYSGQTKVTDFSLIFNGADVQVNADGQAWMSSKANSQAAHDRVAEEARTGGAYDFTSLTPNQMRDVANDLVKSGKIDSQQLLMLLSTDLKLGKVGNAGQYTPVTEAEQTAHSNMPMNYVQYSKDRINFLESKGLTSDPQYGYESWKGILAVLQNATSSSAV